ncbi:MAG: bifunctional enoyl-CoA hydratase/phosphate acetyltransferase [Bacteroidales bacterium]|nr:bifunctional enoyl-CoA hydratase/phosphate acetyltransferase [Bacteroidales bacterium]
MIRKLDELVERAKSHSKKKIAVGAAGDYEVLDAIKHAMKLGIIEPLLVGHKPKIYTIAEEIHLDLEGIEVIHVPDPIDAAFEATRLVREGYANILMKGLVSSQHLLHAVLNKEHGLRKGDILSHVAIFESPYYHKLLGVTDAAMNVSPTFEDKIALIKNAVELFHKIGFERPKVAVVGSVETINPKMEATMHAATLSMMNKRNQIKGCIVDGPLALDNAVSNKAAEIKHIQSEVAGDVDIVVAPDINGANFLYKSLNFIGGATSAAVIMGARVPIVLTSRADTERSKFLSIALAAAME